MHLAACLTSLPLSFEDAVRQAAALGFGWVNVVALADRPPAHLDALADTGVMVSSVLLGRGLPADHSLHAEPIPVRKRALDVHKRQLADAGRLGATHAFLTCVAPEVGAPLARFQEGCQLLADFAAGRQIRLCVGAQHRSALRTVGAAYRWLEDVAHPELALLLDVGHCLRAGEDAAAEAIRAGSRLGAVHVTDVDGDAERIPFFSGRLTPAKVEQLLRALRGAKYSGPITLGLEATLDTPVQHLDDARAAVQRLLSALDG